MDERLEQKKSILINAAYFALLLGIYIFFFRYVIYRIMPFFIAVLIALMLSGPATKLAQKLHIPRRGIAAVLVFIFFAAIGSLITFLVIRLIWAVGNWAEQIPEWYEAYIEPFFARVLAWYEGFAVNLNPELAGYIDDLSGEVLGAGMDVANSVASAVIRATRNVVLSVPGTMVGIVFCIIGSFFITMDFPQISHFLMAQLNERGKTIAVKTREYLVNGLGKIVSSYAKIIGITFVELLIGLSIIGISPLANTAKWAIIIA
ncbi:MAG: AI-2E family transporter, partial [Firmicutes bacterium]|nr:AI-2E family transporter [Bacillota bacterium]